MVQEFTVNSDIEAGGGRIGCGQCDVLPQSRPVEAGVSGFWGKPGIRRPGRLHAADNPVNSKIVTFKQSPTGQTHFDLIFQ